MKKKMQKQVKVLLISECFHIIEWSPLLACSFQYLPYTTCLSPLQPNMSHLIGNFEFIWVKLIDLRSCELAHWIVILSVTIYLYNTIKHREMASRVNLNSVLHNLFMWACFL